MADVGSVSRDGFRDPLFVLAPARSYSTVTVALLAGHPDIFGLPETNLFLRQTIGEIMAMPTGPFTDWDGDRHQLMGLERAIAQLHEGSQDRAALSRALEWIRQRPEESTTDVMEHLLKLVHPRMGVEKSPTTVESDQALTRCMRAFPRASYLHVTRHPVSTQRSMLRLYSQFLFPPWMGHAERVRRCVMTWYSCHLRIVQALREVPQTRRLRVRAEDMLGDPRTGLPPVLDWLGLRYDEAIIDRMLQTQHWVFAEWSGHIGFGGADPLFLAAPRLRDVPPPEGEIIDPRWEIDVGIRDKIVMLAHYLGY